MCGVAIENDVQEVGTASITLWRYLLDMRAAHLFTFYVLKEKDQEKNTDEIFYCVAVRCRHAGYSHIGVRYDAARHYRERSPPSSLEV